MIEAADVTLRMPVEFDFEGETLAGEVLGVMRDIANAQGFAVIEIKHELSGILHQVPLTDLRKRAPK